MGDADAVRLLIEWGADVNARSPRGEWPLRAVIVERRRTSEIKERIRPIDQEKMHLLLDAGADIQTRGKNGGTVLHRAAALDREDLATLLIERGADVNARDDSGWTPLHFAAQQHYLVVVQLLLNRGANVNAETKYRETAVSLAWGDDTLKGLLAQHGGRTAGLVPNAR
jgi:ankyrin repeat protein